MMPVTPVFRTKTGFCHILPDQIVLTRTAVLGSVAQATSSSIFRRLSLYGLLALVFFYCSYDAFHTGRTLEASFFALVGFSLSYGVLTSLNNSATPVIARAAIRRVRFHPARPGVTRAHFVVFFTNEQGKEKKRLILLPGTLAGGPAETKKALVIMTEANLLGS